jgi:type I restriction enzyme R subunit
LKGVLPKDYARPALELNSNQEFCEKYLEDEEFRREIDKILLPLVHERLSKM